MNQLKKLTAMHLAMMGIMQSQMLFKAGVDANLWSSEDYGSSIANELPGKISIIEATFTTVSTQMETEDEDNIRESLKLFKDGREILMNSMQNAAFFKELAEPMKEYLGVLDDMITALEDICG